MSNNSSSSSSLAISLTSFDSNQQEINKMEVFPNFWMTKVVRSVYDCVAPLSNENENESGTSAKQKSRRSTEFSAKTTSCSSNDKTSTNSLFSATKKKRRSESSASSSKDSSGGRSSIKINDIVRYPRHEILWAKNGVLVRVNLPGVKRNNILFYIKGKHIEIKGRKLMDEIDDDDDDDDENIDNNNVDTQQLQQQQQQQKESLPIPKTGFNHNTNRHSTFYANSIDHDRFYVIYKIRFRIDSRFDALLACIQSFEHDILSLSIPLVPSQNSSA